jgi:hypothetical protein
MENELKEGGTYLFSRTNEIALTEITVLLITEKSIKVRYASGHESWFTLQKFDTDNKLVEDITPPTPVKHDFGVLECGENPPFFSWTFRNIHFTDKNEMLKWLDELKNMILF